MTKSRRFLFTSVGGIEITLGPVWLSVLQWCLSNCESELLRSPD